MRRTFSRWVAGGAALALAPAALAGTDVYFNPLTQSSAVASPNHVNELNSPWQAPAGIRQENLTSLNKIEADMTQSSLRIDGAGTSATMWDMVAFDDRGEYIFIPHETPFGAGVTRYDIENDKAEVLFAGDLGGMTGNWANDWGAFDPSTWTPNRTLLVAEEWTAEGRVMEITNPLAPAAAIKVRELDSIVNVAHEGLRFSHDGKTLYFVDEWNSGSIYKFVSRRTGDYTKGQTFVLKVDDYDGPAQDDWNEGANAQAPRTGKATWVPMTDRQGNALTQVDPFRNGPTNDPRSNSDTRGGRPAADELNATPYGRPEDMEVGRLANGNEVVYVTATSENAVYSIEITGDSDAYVRLMASETDTPKNLGFPATTGTLNSPDNLAQDALGNIYIIEDAPNGDTIGGDVWFIRDVNGDGVAESIDHFLSIQVDGAEATGMIFDPVNPTQFVVAVQHPDSISLEDGMGDALWRFDLADVVPPTCDRGGRDSQWAHDDYEDHRHDGRSKRTCSNAGDFQFVKMLEKAGKKPRHSKRGWGNGFGRN